MASDVGPTKPDGARVLEVCVDSVEGARAAAAGGAGRVELCCSMVEGGLTPSIGMVRAVVDDDAAPLPVHVLIRPRAGDFFYSAEELNVCMMDIVAVREAGASGVVIGALTCDGKIDEKAVAAMVAVAKPMSVTFHRAIDVARDPIAAVETCVKLGVNRILTSGGRATATDGADVICSMVRAAAGRLVVMAGAGVSAANARELLRATGVRELHGSARAVVESGMVYRPSPPVWMGGEKFNTDDSEFVRKVATVESVAEVVDAIKSAEPDE